MPLSQLKNVKWSDDERVDLNDLLAVSDLKDADLREYLLGFMEPPPNGRVFTGFTGAAGFGLSFQFDGVDGLAVASDGSLLENPSLLPLVGLTPNATNYVHAYLNETDSDLDNRRFLNDIPTPPEEETQNVPTRQTKVVGFHVTSNADVTPLLGSFQTSAFISGKTRQLVALYAAKTDAFGVTSVVDFRHMWMVSGNVIPAINGGTNELPMTIGATPGDRNVKGLRSMFRALASVLRTISGVTGQDWWNPPTTLQEVIDARTDPDVGTTQTNLQNSRMAAKSARVTVHPTAGKGDFTSVAAAVAAVVGPATIYLKAGTHTEGFIDIGGKTGLHFVGDGVTTTKLVLTTTGFGASSGTVTDCSIENMTLEETGGASAVLFNNSVDGFKMRNCYVKNAGTSSSTISINGSSVKRVRFDNTTFEFNGHVFGTMNGTTLQAITIDHCEFIPVGAFPSLGGDTFGGQWTNMQWTNCTIGQTDSPDWVGIGRSRFARTNVHFHSCTWYNLSEMCKANIADLFVSFEFHGNVFRRTNVSATGAFFGTTGGTANFKNDVITDTVASVLFEGCMLEHGGSIFTVVGANNLMGLNITARNSTFWYSASNGNPMFDLGLASNPFIYSGIHDFQSCKFYYGNCTVNGAVLRCITGASNSSDGINAHFSGCKFSAQKTPGQRAAASASVFAIDVDVQGASGTPIGCFHLTVLASVFHGQTAPQLPIRLAGGSVSTGGYSFFLDFRWGDGNTGGPGPAGVVTTAAGLTADSGVDGSGLAGAAFRLHVITQRLHRNASGTVY